eukprot:478289_1
MNIKHQSDQTNIESERSWGIHQPKGKNHSNQTESLAKYGFSSRKSINKTICTLVCSVCVQIFIHCVRQFHLPSVADVYQQTYNKFPEISDWIRKVHVIRIGISVIKS